MELIYKTENGRLFQGDNIEVMKKIKDNTVDSCISDFPYDLSFMGKKWDTTGNFYEWCKDRAEPLYRIIKPGGYVCIFGHPKTNHRMKSAFEDAGFNIVEEIDWVYGTGFPKNQDIGKMFDKKAGIQGESLGIAKGANSNPKGYKTDGVNGSGGHLKSEYETFAPATDQAIKWNGWKTSGLKPAHEPITVFQKPLEGTYIQNIEKYNIGGMNIDACRIEHNEPIKTTNRKPRSATWNMDTCGFDSTNNTVASADPNGRFPANMIFDSSMGEVLDGQSGERASGSGNGNAIVGENSNGVITPLRRGTLTPRNDTGGASRFFLKIDADEFVPFYYCAKASKKEKDYGLDDMPLKNNMRVNAPRNNEEDKYKTLVKNIHVTVKPKALIKWLIKLVTPLDGKTIDITAGSGTHGLSCEELNKEEGYNLKWINIELLNSEKEPYCEIAMNRIKSVI